MAGKLSVNPGYKFKDQWPGWSAFLGNGRPRLRSPAEWVPVANQLALGNGGELPCTGWLQKNGYGALDRMIRKNPKLFSHLGQGKKVFSREHWVSVAEALVVEYGGTLPCYADLVRDGHQTLASIVSRNPGLFAHINKARFNKTAEEWMVVAINLVEKNGGVLPDRKWMKDHGYDGLSQAIRLKPDLFKEFKQATKRVPLEAWIPIAEKLASENGGRIPSGAWLMKNGYGGLAQAVSKNLGMFSHLGRDVRGKTRTREIKGE